MSGTPYIKLVQIMLLFLSTSVCARQIQVSGVVDNVVNSQGVPNIFVYLPGYPFIGNKDGAQWRALGMTKYDKETGRFALTVDVPDTASNLVVSATINDLEAGVTTAVDIVGKSSVTASLNIPPSQNKVLSFSVKIFYSDTEYDYSKHNSCMLTNNQLVVSGRIVFFNSWEYPLHRNRVYNLPPGTYRVACSIKNLSGGQPLTLRKFVNVTVPLLGSDGVELPEDQRNVEIRFLGAMENGESF